MTEEVPIAIIMCAALVLPASVTAQDTRDARAIAYIAKATGTDPADWKKVAEADTDIGSQRNAVWSAKFLNADEELVRGVIVQPNGEILDADVLAVLRNAANAQLTPLQRKGDRSVAAFVSNASSEDAAAIGVFLSVDTAAAVAAVRTAHPEMKWIGDRADTADPAVASKIEAEMDRAKRAAFKVAEEAFSADAAALGAEVGYSSTAVPLVFVTIPRRQLEAVAGMPNVTDIGMEATWQKPSLAYAGPTVQANWTSGSGDQGNGVRVGIVEYDNVRESGDLAGKVVAVHSSDGPVHYTDPSDFDHPTWAAGAIASQDSVSKGIAPGALIVSSGTGGYIIRDLPRNDREVIEAADWALEDIENGGGGAPIVSLSLVQDTATWSETARKYFDSVQYVGNDLTVAAAGNLGGQCPIGDSGQHTAVGSPGTGWNVLTVGGIDDKNTSSWSDDILWFKPDLSEGSCWEDPDDASWNPHHDFNKPNVSAPAKSVTTANGISASGTSVATPIVAGIAAQLQARNPSYLESWPEAIRAMIMAGAIHKTPKYNGNYSPAREGVGTVSAKWANNAFVDGGGSLGGVVRITKTSASDYTRSFSVGANTKVEIAVVWSSHATSGGSSDQLTADYDLTVTKPDGSVGGSYSWDNSYEYYDFTSDRAGTVSIRVHPVRFDSTREYLALAWVKESSP